MSPVASALRSGLFTPFSGADSQICYLSMAIDLYEWAYVVAYITFSIGLLSSIARFYSRALILKSWGWDDTASCAVLVHYGQPTKSLPLLTVPDR